MNIAFAGIRHSHIFALYREAMSQENVSVIGCFEENEQVRDEIFASRGIEFNYASYGEILCDGRVEAVAIGDYFSKRGRMIIAALEHGKHVICDKPICTSLAELHEIDRLAKEKNLHVHCMLDLRFMPQAERVRELVCSGEIGNVLNASFTAQHHLTYGIRPDWYFEEGKHGGTINDIGIHGIDLLRFITGKNLTKIHAARTWNAFADKVPSFMDSAQFMVEMDGMAVMADVSYSAPKCAALPTFWDVYLWGTHGMINFRAADNRISIYRNTKDVIECSACEPRFIGCLMDAINGAHPIINTADTIESARQVLCIQEYANGNKGVRI